MRILLLEDNATLGRALVQALERDSYAVDHAADAEYASELVAVNDYDALLLDYKLSAHSGLELLESWRASGVETPVLMMTEQVGAESRIRALDAGADDCLGKPFATRELLARLRSLLRRRPGSRSATVAAGDVVMDRAAHQVRVDGRGVSLSPNEFKLLDYFLRNAGKTVTRVDISENVWHSAFNSLANAVDVTVHRLRRKIDGGREAKLIHTVRGVGYTLQPERMLPS